MRNLLKNLLFVVVVALAGYGVSKSINNSAKEKLNGLTLANLEALGQDEGGPDFGNDYYIVYKGMKKRFLSSNCKYHPEYTCRIRVSPISYPELPDFPKLI